jgi:tetrahydromethanopterin S-methyltransferase subunit B
MNLPFVLDVALGLIFVYLILSLLASEIQELIAALLQWRAKHLRESVTNLLQGGEKPPPNEQEQVQQLVKKIYDDPLIRNINQASVEGIASLFRGMTLWLQDIYNSFVQLFLKAARKIPKIGEHLFPKKDRKRTFGDQRSAPSYIPAETFATTLIESVGISDLSKLLMQQRLEKFNQRLVTVIKSTLEDVFSKPVDERERVNRFNDELQQIVEDYKNSEATLQTCIFRIRESFDRLIAFFENHPSSTPAIRSELQAIKTNHFGEKGERAFLFGLSPSPSELTELIDKGSRVYKEIEPVFKAAFNKDSQAIAQRVDQKIVELKLKADAIKSLNLSQSDKEAYFNESSPQIAQRVDQKIVELKHPKLTKEDRAQFASAAIKSLNLSQSDKEAYFNESSAEIAQRVNQKIVELKLAKLTEEDHAQFASAAMESLNLSEFDIKTYEVYITYQKIDRVIDGLPKYVRDSLKILARRAESRIQQVGTQVQQVGNEVDHLRTEIESWFDRSIDRASGVYKRNSKGFAIVLGFVLALATNSDTFHIFSRISNDEKLRQVIVQNATSITQNLNSQQDALDAKSIGCIPVLQVSA